MAILTVNQIIDNIDSFINNIKKLSKSYYMFVGKPDPWSNDATPPIANASIEQTELSLYRDLVYGRLIANTDVTYMIRKIQWANNTVYVQYSQNDPNLIDKDFYVITDNDEVYKCIYNNGNAASTIKPSLNTPIGTFKTSDGYIWKYMYTLDTGANTKFTTNSYIPVTINASVESSAVPGTIDNINITNTGSSYSIYEEGYLVNTIEDGTRVILSNTSNSIDNYYVGSSIYLRSGAGAGQIRDVIQYNGLNKSLEVDPPFTVYVNLNLENVQGTISATDIVTQNLVNIQYLYSVGSFSVGNNVIQSDTGATGTIGVTNSSVIILSKDTLSNNFSSNLPFYNTANAPNVKSGTVTITAGSNFVNTSVSLTSNYASGNYIKVGNTTSNVQIRRIISVNSTVIICDANTPFSQTYIANAHYNVPSVAFATAATSSNSSGVITYTNLNGININITNTTPIGSLFIPGEKVIEVDENDLNQGANAIISFANDSVLELSSVNGVLTTDLYVLGQSSNVKAKISSINSFPNITIQQPLGNFQAALPIFAVDTIGTATGNARIISTSTVPNQLTEYVISPKVTITGDGNGALAYAYVNTDDYVNPTRSISEIRIINTGQNYTYANITISSNNLYGVDATAESVISPVSGHGSNTYMELGAKYAGISVTFANGDNESYKFPVFGSYRKIGIIEDPTVNDATLTLDTFDRVKLYLGTNNNISFIDDEIAYQANTNSAGVVVFSNSSYLELKNVSNTSSGLPFYTAGNTTDTSTQSINTSIIGLLSGASANIVTTQVVNSSVSYFSNVAYFSVLNPNIQSLSEVNSEATARIVSTSNSTTIKISNIKGHFNANDILYDSQTNAYANIVAITIANNTIDASTNFAHKFNQTCRIPLTSNTSTFISFEKVTQQSSNATGTILSSNTDLDIVLSANTTGGTLINGDKLVGNTTGATAIVTWANASYIKCTDTNGTFSVGEVIKNQASVEGIISNIYPVLILYNVYNTFTTGNNTIIGANSGAIGISNTSTTISYPEFIRGSGMTSYIENIVPFTRSNTSTEKINIVIKF